jgi:hypothetical protein
MKNYTVKSGDTFTSIAQEMGINEGHLLRVYHNLNCDEDDIMYNNPIVGKTIVVPEEEIVVFADIDEYNQFLESEVTAENGKDSQPEIENEQEEEVNNEQEKKQEQKSTKSEHEGKHFIIQKGTCQCNQGFKFPKFKVTSHQKHYWNSPDAEEDYLAVTADDLSFDPPAMPFGNCKLRPTSGGYLPCVYSPAGKWQKACEKIKILDKSCLTEISELMCATGGKITILKHGQQSEIVKKNVENANSFEQQIYNPVIDFEEFKDQITQNNVDYY